MTEEEHGMLNGFIERNLMSKQPQEIDAAFIGVRIGTDTQLAMYGGPFECVALADTIVANFNGDTKAALEASERVQTERSVK